MDTVELSDDGDRSVVGQGSSITVIETTSMTTLHSFSVSGAGGSPRLSRDGTVVAAGGFNGKAHVDTGKEWVEVWTEQEETQWYGNGLAIAGDGSMLFSVSRNYSASVILTYRIIDLETGEELARTTTEENSGFGFVGFICRVPLMQWMRVRW